MTALEHAAIVWEALKGRYLPRAPWRKRLLCKHAPLHWVRNIYGDEINATDARSLWQCTKCGAYCYSQKLRLDLEQEEINRMIAKHSA
jgi:hypothetical protein